MSRPRRLVPQVLTQETLLTGFILVFLAVLLVRSPSLFHIETVFNIVRDSLVSAVFAIGVLVVLVSGGIDVSFLVIGIFAAYSTVRLLPTEGGWPLGVLAIAIAIAIGGLLGLVNAAVVILAKVSTLIATLATSAIFMGILFAFVGGNVISRIPAPLRALGEAALVTVPAAERGTTRLPLLVMPVAAVFVLLWVFLTYSTAGRRIYALGGEEEAARRSGISIASTRMLVFALAGGLAGLAGILHVAMAGRADPTAFVGGELAVLAAVVLGGAAITGGRGTVRGTLLGVLTIALIGRSLIPLGVPPIWRTAVVGLMLLLGVALQAITARRRPKRPILAPDDPALVGTVGAAS